MPALGGAVDAVIDRETGLLVDPTDAAVAQAIVTLLLDGELARRLGEAGAERARGLPGRRSPNGSGRYALLEQLAAGGRP